MAARPPPLPRDRRPSDEPLAVPGDDPCCGFRAGHPGCVAGVLADSVNGLIAAVALAVSGPGAAPLAAHHDWLVA